MKIETKVNTVWEFKKKDKARIEKSKDGTTLLVIGNRRFLPVVELLEEQEKGSEHFTSLNRSDDDWEDIHSFMIFENVKIRNIN